MLLVGIEKTILSIHERKLKAKMKGKAKKSMQAMKIKKAVKAKMKAKATKATKEIKSPNVANMLKQAIDFLKTAKKWSSTGRGEDAASVIECAEDELHHVLKVLGHRYI